MVVLYLKLIQHNNNSVSVAPKFLINNYRMLTHC